MFWRIKIIMTFRASGCFEPDRFDWELLAPTIYRGIRANSLQTIFKILLQPEMSTEVLP
jgi:hypothetical protein